MSVTVRTQQELDQALAAKAATIYIEATDGVWLYLPTTGTGSSHVEAWGSSHVVARGSSHVVARGSSHVEAWGSSHVEAWDSSHVVASGSSHVVAWGSSHVEARGSSHVEASKYVGVHLHSQRVTLSGGQVIDLTAIDLTDPVQWCEFHGVEVSKRGVAYLYKAVNDQWTTSRGIDYSPGSKPAAADWNTRRECGGGLHLCVRPVLSLSYYPEATRFVKVGVRVDEMVTLDDKVKVKRVVAAAVEVDRRGKEVVAA